MSVIRAVLIGAAVVLASAGSAQANVVYNWQPLSNSDTIFTDGGKLVFSDAGFLSGSVSKSYKTEAVPFPEDYLSFPDSPILEVSLNVDAYDVVVPRGPIEAFPREGATRNPPLYFLNADIGFSDDLLTGMLSLNDDDSFFSMSAADDGLWTVDEFRSDRLFGAPCGSSEDPSCSGATGEWRLDRSTLPGGAVAVPAPPIWTLFILAVAGLFGVKAAHSRRAAISLAASG